jgi:hypothetical protein
MHRWLGLLVLFFGLPVVTWGQSDTLPEFRPLLRRFWHERFYNAFSASLPAFQLPVVYRDSTYNPDKQKQLGYEVQLAPKPLGLTRRTVLLRGHGYPVSYSVLFQGCLVTLFKHGRFGCYRLPDLLPDERLARQLNVGNWQRFWLIDERLVAQSTDGYYVYDGTTHDWSPYEAAVPFGNRPKLYEDGRYLTYATCNGEFGGAVYFYNKQTHLTHWANATCANTLWQDAGQYHLLVSLGHMMGSADCAAISDPEVLPVVKSFKLRKGFAPVPVRPSQGDSIANWQYAFAKREKGVVRLFSFYGLQLFGGLSYQNQTLYLMHWRRTTFLVTIADKRITIVDPLFANDLYTFNPITTTYGPDLALTNLNSNNEPETTEVAALLWQGQQLTKIEWGKQPNDKK